MFKNYTFDSKDPAQCHTFELYDVDLSIVNGIRRTILTDIEVVGFSGEEDQSVEIHTNTGRLHNEIILHRIGLLPFHVSEVETESFMDGQYTISLDKSNATDAMLNVTTHDIRVMKDDTQVSEKQLHEYFPVDMISKQPILITRLRPKEHLMFTGHAVKRTARFHAGFAPVSLCTFSYIQDPVEAAKHSNILDKERAFLKNEFGDPVAFKFEIEPKVRLSPKYLVNKSLDILINKLTTIEEDLYQPDSTKVVIEDGDTGGVNFTIAEEDDTIGNIIQSHIHTRYVRTKSTSPTVKYVGYYCPHPLDSTVIVNIRLGESSSKEDCIDFMSSAIKSIVSQLQDMSNAWLQFTQKNK